MYLIHPSSIGKIMAEPKSKTEVLSAGAKTYLKTIAREISYDFRPELNVKYVNKGLQCEQDSIDLLNRLHFKNYVKNDKRIKTDLMSGECDILTDTYIRDVKTSWSLETFPVLIEDAHDTIYEWQGRALAASGQWARPRSSRGNPARDAGRTSKGGKKGKRTTAWRTRSPATAPRPAVLALCCDSNILLVLQCDKI